MLIAIRMPKLHTLDEYEIVRINRKVGDTVAKGEHFLDAKLFDDSERMVCFYASGTITEINVTPGSVVSEDAVLGVMEDGK